MKFSSIYTCFCLFSSLALAAPFRNPLPQPPHCPFDRSWLGQLGIQGPLELISTPDAQGHGAFLDLIQNAKSTLHMEMFHLSDPDVVDALLAAARRGIDIRIIVDGGSLKDPDLSAQYDRLVAAGIPVKKSSPAFSITHTKALVADGAVALVTSINLTTHFTTTRDLGLKLTDRSIISELLQLFKTDWTNADRGHGISPCLRNPNLVYSPINSEKKLTGLIAAALPGTPLNVTVENLGDKGVLKALMDAADSGVVVRVIVPLCDKNSNPYFNIPFLQTLAAARVQTKVMPPPATSATPYLHSKMITATTRFGRVSYFGSVNFSNNSIHYSRELGIFVGQDGIPARVDGIFEADWRQAIDVPNPLPPVEDCPTDK